LSEHGPFGEKIHEALKQVASGEKTLSQVEKGLGKQKKLPTLAGLIPKAFGNESGALWIRLSGRHYCNRSIQAKHKRNSPVPTTGRLPIPMAPNKTEARSTVEHANPAIEPPYGHRKQPNK